VQFIEVEQQKARFQTAVHEFTDMCFEKCISTPGPPSRCALSPCLRAHALVSRGRRCIRRRRTAKPGSKLDKSEEACLSNCVERFLDVSNVVVQRLQDKGRQ